MNGSSALLRPLLVVLASIAAISEAGATPLRIENGRTVPRALGAGLDESVRDLARRGEAWIAYVVPMLAGNHDLCCHDWRGSAIRVPCRLDGGSFSVSTGDDPSIPRGVRSGDLWVVIGVGDGRVRKVRTFSGDCALDLGGADLHTLDGVDPQASVDLLSRLIRDRDGAALRDEALTALSHHAATSAGRALLSFTELESPEELRAKAAFWLGARRGAESLEHLRAMVRKDPSPEVREQAVFAISVSDAPGSEAALLDLARRDPRSDVRKTALFWLGQEAGELVAKTLREAVDDDPDVEVKEQAVFALSQLPPARGVPLLIDVARSSGRHPKVRRAAMFWLGQSGDPRALEFFEEVLGQDARDR